MKNSSYSFPEFCFDHKRELDDDVDDDDADDDGDGDYCYYEADVAKRVIHAIICRFSGGASSWRYHESGTADDGRRTAAALLRQHFRLGRYLQPSTVDRADCQHSLGALRGTTESEYLHIRFRSRDTPSEAATVSAFLVLSLDGLPLLAINANLNEDLINDRLLGSPLGAIRID